jgi:ribosomal protein S3AE
MIRKKMIEIMTATIQKNQLRDLVKILVKEEIGNEIQK